MYLRIIIFILGIAILLILLTIMGLAFKTGAFGTDAIDKTDLQKWNRTDGVINGAQEVRVYSSNKTCWLMIHGYASTPRDFNTLMPQIIGEFNETVIVPRLKGHGEIPSKITNLSFPDWYSQIEGEFNVLEKSCGRVNVVGFSFGGALALRLAEKHQVNNIYLISPFLKIRYKKYHIFPKEDYISLIADKVRYSVKYEVAQLNSEEGKREYIGYYSFPLIPLKKSFPYMQQIEKDLGKVNASRALILHSKNDDTIDVKSSLIINSSLKIEKETVIYTRSNHVLLMDYDKEDAIKRIIAFEKEGR